MTRLPPASSVLARITVTSDRRRADLAVPSTVPVAELLPALARSVGLLDPSTAYAGCRAVTLRGEVLRADVSLSAQGVGHGDIIAISAAADDEPPERHDDLAEAISRAVGGVPPWTPDLGRRTSLGAATALFVVGAPALLAGPGRGSAAWFAAALAGVLLAGAVLISRTRRDVVAAVTMAHLACLYAAVAGLSSAWQVSLDGRALEHAGGALVAAGGMAALAMPRGRVLMLPGVLVGAVVLAAGLATRVTTLDPAPLMTGWLALVVIVSGGFPAAALSATGTGRHARVLVDAMQAGVPTGIDLARVSADVRVAREILVAASVTSGSLLVLMAPMAVSLGPAGSAVPVLGSAVVLLRTRRYRAAADVLIGVASGVLGMVSTVLSLLWLDEEWCLAAGATVATGGLVVLMATLRPADDAGPGRLGDLVERAALGALVPAALLAVGLSFGQR